MAYWRFQQGLPSFSSNPLSRSLLLWACLLGLLIVIPPESVGQPPAAQPSKKPSPKPSPKELLAKARALEAKKQYAEAIEAYREYLVIRPKDDEIRFILARLLAQQNKQAEAAELYELILSQAPGNLAAKRGLADALAASGKQADALPHYMALYLATKDPALAEKIKKIKEALGLPLRPASEPAETPVAPLPVPIDPEETLERARSLEESQQYIAAMRTYQEYLKVRPADDEALRSLARVFALQGYTKEAMAAYKQVLARHPSDLTALLGIGKILVQQGHNAEAQPYYQAALRADPSNLEAKRALGNFYYRDDNFLLALRYYEEVFRATQDPTIGKRIRMIRDQQVLSPQAPLSMVEQTPTLPFRSYMKLGYSQYAYTNNVPDERDGRLEVSRPFGDFTVRAGMEFLHRFGDDDIPLSMELYGPLWRKAWGVVNGAAAVNPSFVPNFRLGAQIFQDLGVLHQSLSFLEVSFGYERLAYGYRANTSPTLFIPAQDISLLTPTLTMYLPFNVWLTEKLYYIPETGSITLSSKLTWRPTDRLQLFASGGFGTSGEKIYAFQDFTRRDTRTVQGGAIFPLTDRLSGELLGFYEDRSTLYIRRGGTFNLIWHW